MGCIKATVYVWRLLRKPVPIASLSLETPAICESRVVAQGRAVYGPNPSLTPIFISSYYSIS